MAQTDHWSSKTCRLAWSSRKVTSYHFNEAKRIISDWRNHYNNVRPHSSPGYRAPTVFEAEAA